jgi:choice-of-anchor C domain-containing protein
MVVRLGVSGAIYEVSATARIVSGSATDVVDCVDSGGDLVCDLSSYSVPKDSWIDVLGELSADGPGSVKVTAQAVSWVSDPQTSNNVGVAGWDFACPADLPQWDPLNKQCQACPAFVNGSFESATVNPGAGLITALPTGDTRIEGWTVTGGDIDYIGGYWSAADGARSLDMSGFQAGSISQDFGTVIGELYEVRFALSGEPFSHPPVTKNLRVSSGGTTADFSFDSRSSTSRSSMVWSEQSFTFVAGSATSTLTFSSLDSSDAGPALDNVRVYGRCQATAP